MNAKIIEQLVMDLEEISDQQLQFGSLYNMTTDKRGRKGESFGPLGNHIRQHPELKELLGVKLRTEDYPYHPTISEMLNTSAKSFTYHREWWVIDNAKVEEYFGLSYEHTRLLFYNSRFTRKEFVDTITAFVNGELDIRECHNEGCDTIYTTSPDDEACVCDYCKESLLDMCGM